MLRASLVVIARSPSIIGDEIKSNQIGLIFSFPQNYFLITNTIQYVSRNLNEILLSKDALADYTTTPEVTFSIRNFRKLYQDIRDNVSTPKVFNEIQKETHCV